MTRAACCRAFVVNVPYGLLRQAYLAWISGKPGIPYEGRVGVIEDIHLIYPMLVPLGKHRVNPVNGKEYTEPVALYNCKHLRADETCSIYSIRPRMCRNFPEGACNFPSCSRRKCKDGVRQVPYTTIPPPQRGRHALPSRT